VKIVVVDVNVVVDGFGECGYDQASLRGPHP
jgi:hypothetical protein